MNAWRFIMIVGVYLMMMVGLGCASNKSAPMTVLDPPPDVDSHILLLFNEGNRLFQEGRWEGAQEQFQSAVQQQADLAEAHYNLALSMDRMGDKDGAKKHYIEAANLAPGHKVIWNSPPLRRYGNVPDAPSSGTATGMPPFGGGARPTGIGGMGF